MFNINNKAKPVLKWAGGKTKILPELLKHFPNKFDRYIEPFFGGGAVFFSLDTNTKAVINDLNEQLITLYKVIKSEPKRLMEELDILQKQYSEEFYYKLRTYKPINEIEIAARLVFLNKTCFNGLYRENSKGQFNVPFGKKIKCPNLYDKQNLLEVSKRLSNTEIKCQDFETIIKEAGKGDFIYCDPPYEPISATACFKSYTSNSFTIKDQQRLKDCCLEAAAKGAVVIISNSSAPQIKTLFNDCEILTIKAPRSISCKGNLRKEILEFLIKIN